ncbi:hypothetical protein MHH28_09445 [Paenibacillus sp. FSL K6-1217]|uniref:hypothetical protein n=1 Tax=Paenibacillus sp. FSL K6-1217 TaxID=2921466 RepID=UPI0032449D49
MEFDFIKYLPVIAAIFSAVLGYLFGVRSKTNERLIRYTEENLKEVFSPIYHDFLKINSEQRSREKEELIDSFFMNYLERDTLIYKIGNLELLNTFYGLNEKYNIFKKERSELLWEEFYKDFYFKFFLKLKEKYENSTILLYRDFNWQQYTQSKPYWLKFYFEIINFLFETFKGIVWISIFLTYFSGASNLIGKDLFPKDFWMLSLFILGSSALVTLVLLFLNIQYLILTSTSQQSLIRKIMKKHAPIIFRKWDGFLSVDNNINIPKMYKKQLFEDE